MFEKYYVLCARESILAHIWYEWKVSVTVNKHISKHMLCKVKAKIKKNAQ